MKKLLCALLIITMLAGFSGTGFADVIPFLDPSPETEVTVVNPDGIKLSDDEVIPYGTVCYVAKFNYPKQRGYSSGDENYVMIRYGNTLLSVPIDDVDGECITEFKEYMEEYNSSILFSPEDPDDPVDEENPVIRFLQNIRYGFREFINSVSEFFGALFDRIESYFAA